MSLSANRREVIAGAAAASVIAPLAASAKRTDNNKAPTITIFDARGCDAKKSNYAGAKAGGMEDDQCVKLSMETVSISKATAAKKLQEFINLKDTGFGAKSISGNTKKY